MLLFVDSMYRLQSFESSDADSKMGLSKTSRGSPGLSNPMALTMLFRNQRNAYISGFCLILLVVLHRLLNNAEALHKMKRENKQLRTRLGLPATGKLPEESKDGQKGDKAASASSAPATATTAVKTENVASAPPKDLLTKKND